MESMDSLDNQPSISIGFVETMQLSGGHGGYGIPCRITYTEEVAGSSPVPLTLLPQYMGVSRFCVDSGLGISFAVVSRSIPLSTRISQDVFLVAVHIGRRMFDDRVLSVKRRALSDRFSEFLNREGSLDDLPPMDLRWTG